MLLNINKNKAAPGQILVITYQNLRAAQAKSYIIIPVQFWSFSLQRAREIIFCGVRRSRNPAASGGREGGDAYAKQ